MSGRGWTDSTETGRAIRIDFEAELEATARGECLACRIGARHGGEGLKCPRAKEWGDVWCARGRHDYPKEVRGGELVRCGPCLHCGGDVVIVTTRGWYWTKDGREVSSVSGPERGTAAYLEYARRECPEGAAFRVIENKDNPTIL